jgi:hypothetical protein
VAREGNDVNTAKTVTVESDWLPAAELDRLVSECRRDAPGVELANAGQPAHRGLDPSLAVALITGFVDVVIPFVTKLAERVFSKEPEAVLTLDDEAGSGAVALYATMPPEERDELVMDALKSGALRLRISLEAPAS